MTLAGVQLVQDEQLAGCLAALDARTRPDPWSEAGWRAELLHPSGRIWMVRQETELIAFACYRLCGPEAELLYVAVAPERRRQRLGARLLRETFAELSAQGVRELFLEVRLGNDPARRLYEALGFHVTGRRNRYYADGEDAVLMARSLP